MKILPLRILRQSVGLAVRGVKAGFGGTVRFVWPRRKKRNRSITAKSQAVFLDRWTSTVRKFPFQSELCTDGRSDHCQSLVTVGSRQWGNRWDARSMLAVRIYEFAVYVDPQQMRKSRLSHVVRTEGEALPKNKRFYRLLRSNDEVDMSILVKASRSLPLKTMSTEYEKILKRRLLRVGGRIDDPSLSGFLEMFTQARLPAQVQDKQNNVKSGSTICFQKFRDGTLTTYADNHKVGQVKSKALCSALFDLYLGEEPVSLDARTLAANRLVHMIVCEDSIKQKSAKPDTLLNLQKQERTLGYLASLL